MIYSSSPVLLEAIMMGILLEQEKALTGLQEDTSRLEAEIRPSSDRPATD